MVWAGKPAHSDDINRSVDLGHFTSIVNMEGCIFYSLQVGERRQDIGQHNLNESLIDLGQDLADFAVTASAIEQLDLVISVDTAVAHLAGALGKPVWTLLPYMPDWRWMLDREDTPWYPTMRLFRQKKPGDWEGVFRDVEIRLRERVRG